MTRAKKHTFNLGDVLQDKTRTDRLVVVVEQLDQDTFRTLTLCGAIELVDTELLHTRYELHQWFTKVSCA